MGLHDVLQATYTAAGSDLSDLDIVMFKVRNIWAGDSDITAIVAADRIEILPALRPNDWGDTPRLQIAPSTFGIGPSPGHEKSRKRFYARIRYSQEDWGTIKQGAAETLTWPYGKATLDSFVWRLHRSLRAAGNKGLTETIGGQQVDLVRRIWIGDTDFTIDLDDSTGRVFYNQLLGWDYETKLDPDTGRIWSVEAAGG